MIEYLLEVDKELFLILNRFHAPWLDPVMLYITDTMVWLPLHIYLLYLIFKDYGKQGWFICAGLALTIILADQVTSSLMKPYFERLRPSHDPIFEGLVHIVDGYRGGKYGFASSHAANTFGAATFLFLRFRKKRKWISLLFMWAAVVTYSRIYLGVHYPGDIVIGSLVGVLAAFAAFYFYLLICRLFEKQQTFSRRRK